MVSLQTHRDTNRGGHNTGGHKRGRGGYMVSLSLDRQEHREREEETGTQRTREEIRLDRHGGTQERVGEKGTC
jgi:hypothetical protein